MITVGYGDILPITKFEMIFCVVNMMISCAVFGKKKNEIIKKKKITNININIKKINFFKFILFFF
jgi:hypothetical protein